MTISIVRQLINLRNVCFYYSHVGYNSQNLTGTTVNKMSSEFERKDESKNNCSRKYVSASIFSSATFFTGCDFYFHFPSEFTSRKSAALLKKICIQMRFIFNLSKIEIFFNVFQNYITIQTLDWGFIHLTKKLSLLLINPFPSNLVSFFVVKK